MATQGARPAAPSPSRRLRALIAAMTLALAGVGLVVLYRQSSGLVQVELTLVHGEEEVSIDAVEGTPLSELVEAFGIVPVDGRLLSVTGAVLEEGAAPARILVDGHPATTSDPVIRGIERIEVVDGDDRVEGTKTVEEDELPPAGPDVLRYVEERGAPGRVRRTVGEISGELASSETLVPVRPPTRTERKVVALTFDDGPSAAWTPYVLEILRSRGVKATFCMVGSAVEKNPEIARQVVADGHQVCNHTQTHDLGLAGAGQEQVDREVGGGRATMIDQGLPEPAFYRPPGGNLSDLVTATARAQGERVLMWKVDTKDWQSRSSVDSVMQNLRDQVEPGAVILMHDGGGANRHTSIAVLAGLIDELRADGYEFTFPVIDPA